MSQDPSRRSVRLVDVAERAGVSMKTVSNVVRHHPHVSAAMRQRVQSAIDELGYRPNLTARQLATGRTGMVALSLPELDQPYFAELARYTAELAPQFGLRVLIEQTLLMIDAEHAVLRDRDNGLVDGVIFHPIRMSHAEIAALPGDVPLVLLGESAPSTTDHVMMDNVGAAREVVAHFVSGGRRNIVFLGTVTDETSEATKPRLQGYREGLRAAGLPADDRGVLECAAYSSEAAEAALTDALTAGQEIDAVLCREDRFAAGALRALERAGRDVPTDVAVVGWDDTHLTQWTTPALTSVAPDKRELARVALRLLDERINGFRGPGRHRLIPHTLTIRDSA